MLYVYYKETSRKFIEKNSHVDGLMNRICKIKGLKKTLVGRIRLL